MSAAFGIISGILQTVGSIGTVIAASNANKFNEEDAWKYQFQEVGSPGLAGRISGVQGGFLADSQKYKKKVVDKRAQGWSEFGTRLAMFANAGSSVANTAQYAFGSKDGQEDTGRVDIQKADPIEATSVTPNPDMKQDPPDKLEYREAEDGIYSPSLGTITSVGMQEDPFLKRKDLLTAKLAQGGYSGVGMGQKKIVSIQPIKGKSHAAGGEKMQLNGKTIEAQGGEYLIKFEDGSEAVFNQDQIRMLKEGVPVKKILASMPKV